MLESNFLAHSANWLEGLYILVVGKMRRVAVSVVGRRMPCIKKLEPLGYHVSLGDPMFSHLDIHWSVTDRHTQTERHMMMAYTVLAWCCTVKN